MNKNLKKVISAVAALAMSVTSFVAMASYPDVADTDKHASAINELSALGVIEGFEDGSFHPDELVTRAQMAAMVCRALNNFNAESNNIQKFNDVAADNWAAGWVATAADAGIINGTGNGNFDPDLNVTYAQTAKMLVSAMGYGDWAENQGGWPSGYLSYANSTGVTANISGVANDTALTRAQCAQMIANALEAPILKQTSVQTGYDGKPYAVMTQMDGTNADKSPFTSLLIDKWDMYVVNGTVTKTNKSDSTYAVDEAQYTVSQSKNYMGLSYASSLLPSAGKDTTGAYVKTPVTVKVGNVNADSYLNVYTKAIIKNDDYNDAELVYIEGSNKNVEVKFETNLIDASDYYSADTNYDVLKVKKSLSTNTKTSYKLNKGWTLVVNGAEVTADTTNLAKYITYAGNPGATVTLTDYPTSGTSVDGYYDVISVDYVVTAVVDEVVDDTDATYVYFKNCTAAGVGYIEVKKDDDAYSYKFTKDGAAINATELAEYDVLSIIASVDASSTFETSTFYDVTVSNATVEGKVTQSGTDDATGETFYTVNGENYNVVNGMIGASEIRTGDEYTFYMTVDGKIAAQDKLASSINYAILERAYNANSGEVMVRLIARDGQKYEYELADKGDSDLKNPSDSGANGIVKKLLDAGTAWTKGDDSGKLTLAGIALEDRVVDYSLTSGNKIKIKAAAATDMTAKDSAGAKEYKASTSRLGSDKVDDATVVLDLSSWVENRSNAVTLVSTSSLVDGAEYKYVSATNKSTKVLPFVAVYDGFGGWNNETQMAVVSKKLSTSVDGITRNVLEVYYNGELTQITCADDSIGSELKEGDAIIFDTDSDGYVDKIEKIMTASVGATKYDFFKGIKAGTAINTNLSGANALTGPDGKVTFVLAPVISKTSSEIEIPVGADYASTIKCDSAINSKEAWYVSINDTDTISYADDVNVYSYKGNNSNGYKVSKGAAASVIASSVPSVGYLDSDSIYINLGAKDETKSMNTITFALLRVYDDEVQEVYSIQTSDANGREAVFAK